MRRDNSDRCGFDAPGTKDTDESHECHNGTGCYEDVGAMCKVCAECYCRTCIHGKCPPSANVEWRE